MASNDNNGTSNTGKDGKNNTASRNRSAAAAEEDDDTAAAAAEREPPPYDPRRFQNPHPDDRDGGGARAGGCGRGCEPHTVAPHAPQCLVTATPDKAVVEAHASTNSPTVVTETSVRTVHPSAREDSRAKWAADMADPPPAPPRQQDRGQPQREVEHFQRL